jgi:hypothetical protein
MVTEGGNNNPAGITTIKQD